MYLIIDFRYTKNGKTALNTELETMTEEVKEEIKEEVNKESSCWIMYIQHVQANNWDLLTVIIILFTVQHLSS